MYVSGSTVTIRRTGSQYSFPKFRTLITTEPRVAFNDKPGTIFYVDYITVCG